MKKYTNPQLLFFDEKQIGSRKVNDAIFYNSNKKSLCNYLPRPELFGFFFMKQNWSHRNKPVHGQ